PFARDPPSNRTSGSPTSGSPRALPSRVRLQSSAQHPQADQAVVTPEYSHGVLLRGLVSPLPGDMGPHSAQNPLIESPEELPHMRLPVVVAPPSYNGVQPPDELLRPTPR